LRYSTAALSIHNPEPQPLAGVTLKSEITQEGFSRFLEWLDPDLERAGEEYERLRFRLCRFFSLRHCNFADELADETINRGILKISAEQIENKSAYCYGFAKNVYLESLRKQRPQVDIDEVTIAVNAPEPQGFSNECLDKCLERLSSESRKLLLDYFSETKDKKIELHQRIAETLRMTQTALRMRVMRSKQKLKICVQECMS
jgi:DNA-directed RNA polymerase specialized sigma24 family protein